MKRLATLVIGIFIGALLFGSIPALANSVKSLVGSKVTGVFTIEKNGKKIAESAIINGSAYVPVRVMAEATGTPITVEGKVITLGGTQQNNAILDDINIQKDAVLRRIKISEAAIMQYETDVIPRAKERYEEAKDSPVETQRKEWLESINKDLEQYRSDLVDAQKQLADIEVQITGLKE
ncbi:hypothetical protein [Paenibacillus sp. CMAA1364]